MHLIRLYSTQDEFGMRNFRRLKKYINEFKEFIEDYYKCLNLECIYINLLYCGYPKLNKVKCLVPGRVLNVDNIDMYRLKFRFSEYTVFSIYINVEDNIYYDRIMLYIIPYMGTNLIAKFDVFKENFDSNKVNKNNWICI